MPTDTPASSPERLDPETLAASVIAELRRRAETERATAKIIGGLRRDRYCHAAEALEQAADAIAAYRAALATPAREGPDAGRRLEAAEVMAQAAREFRCADLEARQFGIEGAEWIVQDEARCKAMEAADRLDAARLAYEVVKRSAPPRAIPAPRAAAERDGEDA